LFSYTFIFDLPTPWSMLLTSKWWRYVSSSMKHRCVIGKKTTMSRHIDHVCMLRRRICLDNSPCLCQAGWIIHWEAKISSRHASTLKQFTIALELFNMKHWNVSYLSGSVNSSRQLTCLVLYFHWFFCSREPLQNIFNPWIVNFP
jgi:hypothetical protein